jgi:hypothetical protein
MTLNEWNRWRADLRAGLHQDLARPLATGVRAEAWTGRQVLHHILLTNASIVRLGERLLEQKPAEAPHQGPDWPWPVAPTLLDFPAARAFSIGAVPGTEPSNSVTAEALADLEAETDRGFAWLGDQASRRQCADLVFPHRLAGPLNLYEWLVFATVHEHLHRERLRADL